MPVYKVAHPATGKLISINGDTPPTEQELDQIFAETGGGKADPYAGQDLGTMRAITWRDKASSIYRDAASMAGTAIGGFLGASTSATEGPAAPLTIVPKAAIGAGLGNAIANQSADLADRYVWKIPEAQTPDLPDAARQGISDFMLGAIGEGVGPAIGKSVSRAGRAVLSPYTEALTPERRAAIQGLEKIGVNTTIGERVGGNAWPGFERFLRVMPGSSKFMAERDMDRLQKLVDHRNMLLQAGDTSGTAEDVGAQIKKELEGIIGKNSALNDKAKESLRKRITDRFGINRPMTDVANTFRLAGVDASRLLRTRKNDAYDKVGGLIAQDADIPTPRLQAAAQDLLEKELAMPASQRDTTLMATLGDFAGGKDGKTVVMHDLDGSYIVDNGGKPVLTWDVLARTRSNLNAAIRSNNRALGTGAPGLSGQMTDAAPKYGALKKALSEDMGEFASAASPEAKAAWETANRINIEYKGLYGKDSDFVNRIIQSNDPAALNGVSRTVFANKDTVGLARKAFGAKAVSDLQRAHISSLVADSTDPISGFDGAAFTRKLAGMGSDTLLSMFGDYGTVKAVMGLGKAGYNLSRVPRDIVERIAARPDGAIVPFLINARTATQSANVVSRLPLDLQQQVRGQFLLAVLGGEGNTASPATMGRFAADIRVGRIPANVDRFHALGKQLLGSADWAAIQDFARGLKFLGAANKSGFSPSGQHVTQSGVFRSAINPLNWPAMALETGMTAVASRLYYSDALKKMVERDMLSPARAKAIESAISRYFPGTIVPAVADRAISPNRRDLRQGIPATQGDINQ